jgi:hypothetical protein
MRFSTIAAVSAIVLGVNAIANPDVIVYETKVVTITSCPPEKPACPASHSTTYVPVPTTTPVAPAPPAVTTTPAAPAPPAPSAPAPVESAKPVAPAPVAPVAPAPPVYGNGTTPVAPVAPAPEHEKPAPVAPVAPISTGTGVPSAPGNNSSPVVPVSPPAEFEGAGSKMGVSILAIAGAAVFALMA